MSSPQETDQSEFDFLSFCHQMQQEEGHDWNSMVINYSATLKPRTLLKNPAQIDAVLKQNREAALRTFHTINEEAKKLKTKAVSYIFADNDIVLCADLQGPVQKGCFHDLRQATATILPPDVPLQHLSIQDDIQKILQMADDKLISARRMRGYHAIGTDNIKRDTLGMRRAGRKVPLVMLVEDDRFSAFYTAQLLANDYEVFHVRTGEEAAEYYLDYAPDAVFIDLHLPGMPGTEVLQLIKAIDPDAHCIILSVDGAAGAVMDASRSGAHSYLRKPYNKERLLWTVRQAPRILSMTSAAIQGHV